MSLLSLSSTLALLPEISLLLLLVAILAYDRILKPTERRRVGSLSAWGFFITLLITVGLFYFFR